MFSRVVAVAQVVLFAAAVSGWAADDAKTYSGTFKDSLGREGPLSCALTLKEAGKYTASFKAKNTGKGPNRDYTCATEFAGKGEGAKVDLSGEVPMGKTAMEVTAVLEGQTLKATFKTKDGKNDGSFDLKLGEPVAATADVKKEADTPKEK